MGDRQDIDALLIGALYGELDAADKTRLEAHLASHPADRAAMDSLADTRTRVRDNLSRLSDAEPAPAITALLLQEAARRAPRKAREGGVMGWLSGLLRPIVAHPAMAGAFALLVIGGAAGVLYKSGKVDADDRSTIASEGEPPPAAPSMTAGSAAPATPSGGAPDKADAYQVNLDNAAKDRQTTLTDKAPASSGPADDGVARDQTAARGDLAFAEEKPKANLPAPKGTAGLAKKTSPGYVEIHRSEPQLKSLDDARDPDVAQGGGGAGVGAGSARVIAGDTAGAPGRDAPRPAPTTAAQPAYDRAKDAKLDEWAQIQHKQMVQLVKDGKCPEAGRVGSEIASRAPEYYAANVENDRSIRQCKQYIDQAKRKQAAEHAKSRARGSFDADLESPFAEPAPAPTTSH